MPVNEWLNNVIPNNPLPRVLQIYYFSQDTIVRSIDRSDDKYISVRVGSSTHLEVFCNATWVDTLGNYDDVPLNHPSDDYLKEQCF